MNRDIRAGMKLKNKLTGREIEVLNRHKRDREWNCRTGRKTTHRIPEHTLRRWYVRQNTGE